MSTGWPLAKAQSGDKESTNDVRGQLEAIRTDAQYVLGSDWHVMVWMVDATEDCEAEVRMAVERCYCAKRYTSSAIIPFHQLMIYKGGERKFIVGRVSDCAVQLVIEMMEMIVL